MYSNNKLVLQIISLLKQFEIKRVVVSPGSRHFSLVHSLEADEYFNLYSVVDERSAAFFALGMIQQTGEPVAITCSSGTACMNYGSAIVEAFYQKLPLLVLSSDRPRELLNQLEDQMYDQLDTFTKCTKYQGQLPEIKNDTDEWYANRILNEGFLELNHHGKGPVHLNIPFTSHRNDTFSTISLPKVRKISLRRADATTEMWIEAATNLKNKKVMIIWGQSVPSTECLKKAIDNFCKCFDTVILTDKISNFHHPKAIYNVPAILSSLKREDKTNLMPNIVISIGGNYIFNNEIKALLRPAKIPHWQVGYEDKVCDPFRSLTEIFEMGETFFFEQLSSVSSITHQNNYEEAWKQISQQIPIPTAEIGELYAIGKLLTNFPENADLQLANSCTIRMAHFFPTKASVRINCNRGVNGIDGSMSTTVGFAAANANATFLIIGDLSFFYDMNALWNRYISKKLRILLINNEGGAVMYAPINENMRKSLPEHIAAGHMTSAKGWVESLGFSYIEASSKKEIDSGIKTLTDLSIEHPILMEVHSKTIDDIHAMQEFTSSLYCPSISEKIANEAKNIAKKAIRIIKQ
ncbi:2-succinyl-5-enolpyruvyl-6-hydroxy-3-cyclohexene-1-carboxylic-acid synthase [Bacteroides oleiciplenus]|uniref:2-succinyl-5-enolpyruvyl-6-hydroxy-3-cyclohexene-1-carboxylic-acid synthase n=1 Tax=Bacteroides oleiciplenus TaxID=626931 RepID=A0A3E5AYA4_9BACE|nr:2-succinyl-5-enolpyruvyl-6-hydroxy-3-cyclohexene-1-carboxylic-acid synthase [Bacteroides oleiciplenus]RGN30317.1 2-succinyl-5-enolpyruvyl-6-hydroxy-3-cyclohexene-1-carboxylic-acid synthase [Bacteroides oleiciplenus]